MHLRHKRTTLEKCPEHRIVSGGREVTWPKVRAGQRDVLLSDIFRKLELDRHGCRRRFLFCKLQVKKACKLELVGLYRLKLKLQNEMEQAAFGDLHTRWGGVSYMCDGCLSVATNLPVCRILIHRVPSWNSRDQNCVNFVGRHINGRVRENGTPIALRWNMQRR